MQKFKAGDKVRIINYGHLGHYSSAKSLNEFKSFEQASQEYIDTLLLWGPGAKTEIKNKDFSHLILHIDESGWVTIDQCPSLIGKEGVIEGSYYDLYKGDEERNFKTYSIKGIPGKTSWYDEAQLELI